MGARHRLLTGNTKKGERGAHFAYVLFAFSFTDRYIWQRSWLLVIIDAIITNIIRIEYRDIRY